MMLKATALDLQHHYQATRCRFLDCKLSTFALFLEKKVGLNR
jgi:hypothetical protein